MAALTIRQVDSSDAPFNLLLEADPSLDQIETYLPISECYVAEEKGEIVGVCVLCRRSEKMTELMNIAVAPARQRQGIGTRILKEAISVARSSKLESLEVGTGTFGYQLAFYQRAGFRVDRIDKDFFLKNYTEPIFENGIQLKDMLRLVLYLEQINE